MHFDDELGRDNAFGRVLKGANQMLMLTNPYVFDTNKKIMTGETNLIVQITGYNALPNDPQVDVSVFVSGGLFDDAGATKVPTFAPDESWSIDPVSIQLDDATNFLGKYRSDQAYVTEGVLVAHFALAPLPLVLQKDSAIVDLSNGVMTARLVRQKDGSYRLNEGRVGGRASTKAILTTLGHFEDPTSDAGARFCDEAEDEGLKGILKTTACLSADITHEPASDGTGPCDSLSVAFGFSAAPARYAGRFVRIHPNGCDGGMKWSDECENDFVK